MSCPGDKKPVIAQFCNDAESFWEEFKKENPGKSEIALSIFFDERYGRCFGRNAPPHSPATSFNLDQEIKDAVKECMLKHD
ncbi:hypothetical protein LG204_06995 [Methylovorus menthalis]|uniref:hypothetical protein n=1 Tax=Methylovorus menthalis TaxID=1002227 RepID=UPI001E50A217|nr:hypothetical protein [Methylovorus menthalis]MCB4811058.1 hypothetical protein [Methylovorus menthalis]